MAETLYHPPVEVRQGTTVEWTTVSEDYPATDGYAATFTAVATSGSLAVTGTVDGADWDFTLTATQTAALQPGSYEYSIKLTLGAAVYVIEAGYLYILADVTAEQPLGVAGVSPARQRHDHYVKLVTNESFVKTLQPGQLAEMEEIIRRLEWDLKREEDAEKLRRGINATRKLYTRFI
jgi:hypothetical protein